MNTDTRNIWIGAIVLIIIIVGIILVGKNKATAPGDETAGNVTPEGWEVWESGTYNSGDDVSTLYNISHPEEFVVSKRSTARGGFLNNPLVTFSFPENSFAEPKSNFVDGFATVSSSTSKNTEAKCFAKPSGATGEYADVETTEDNDMMLKRIDTDTSRIYRTLYDGTCYEVTLTVDTDAIVDSDADDATVAEFDKEEAYTVLENIRKSFSLRKEEGPLK